jgi:hypothetical protein
VFCVRAEATFEGGYMVGKTHGETGDSRLVASPGVACRSDLEGTACAF